MADEDDGSFYKVFIGNFDYECDLRTMEKLVSKFGELDHIDMKVGFCFCYFKNKSDAEECIDALDGRDGPGSRPRRMRVEMARGDGKIKSREVERRRKVEPNKALFVVNFDRSSTREEELRAHFDRFGPLQRVHMTKNYAFVEFESLDDATTAKQETDGSDFQGHKITVEYVASAKGSRQWGDDQPSPRGGGSRLDRLQGPPLERGGYRPRRSPSPYRSRNRGRERSYDKRDRDRYERRSPSYERDRYRSRRSPSPYRSRRSISPAYGRR